jgi:hypothetical protein
MPSPIDQAFIDARREVTRAHGKPSRHMDQRTSWRTAVQDVAMQLLRDRGIPVEDQHNFRPCLLCKSTQRRTGRKVVHVDRQSDRSDVAMRSGRDAGGSRLTHRGVALSGGAA